MKIETILNAIEDSWEDILWLSQYDQDIYIQQVGRRKRQYNTFRARIIRMDERNKMEIARLEKFIEDHTATLANGWIISRRKNDDYRR